MINISRLTKRIAYVTAATVMSLSSLLALLPQSAFAVQTQVQSRQIKMSTSAAAATSVTYEVKFNVAQGYSAGGLKGIVVEFCADSPIIDSTSCTNPNSFATTSVTLTSTAGTMDASGWAATTIDTAKGVAITKAAGNSGTITSGDTQTITLGGITNPNAVGTFYARIYTYAATATATGFLAASGPGAYLDYGGVALSIANQITVTAKVQETLTFCVFTSNLTTGVSCPGTVSGMKLGDANGVLASTTTAYLTSTNAGTPLYAQLGLASNASSGVTVRAKASGTLTSSTGTIAAIGSTPGDGNCFADSSTATVEQFGFRITAGSGGTGTQTVDAGYSCSAGNHSFDSTNLASSFGDPVLTTAGPSTEPTTEALVDFVGKAATTTKSGVYTSTLTFIATGVY